MAGKRRSNDEIFRDGGRVCSLCGGEPKPLTAFRIRSNGCQIPRCKKCESDEEKKRQALGLPRGRPLGSNTRQIDALPCFDDGAITAAMGYPTRG